MSFELEKMVRLFYEQFNIEPLKWQTINGRRTKGPRQIYDNQYLQLHCLLADYKAVSMTNVNDLKRVILFYSCHKLIDKMLIGDKAETLKYFNQVRKVFQLKEYKGDIQSEYYQKIKFDYEGEHNVNTKSIS